MPKSVRRGLIKSVNNARSTLAPQSPNFTLNFYTGQSGYRLDRLGLGLPSLTLVACDHQSRKIYQLLHCDAKLFTGIGI